MNIINPIMKVIEDFHFAFEVVDNVDGKRIVVVRDAIHSLLYH
jgi:predicted GTPase